MTHNAPLTLREIIAAYHANLCTANEALATMVAQGMNETDAALELACAVPDDVMDRIFLDWTRS